MLLKHVWGFILNCELIISKHQHDCALKSRSSGTLGLRLCLRLHALPLAILISDTWNTCKVTPGSWVAGQ